MAISRGLFNQTLTLQSKTAVDDGMGSRVETWADLGSFRGRISPLTRIDNQERLMQDKTTMITTHRIYCDPMTVTPNNRIRWGTYYFEIIAITNPSEEYHHLEIDAREINQP